MPKELDEHQPLSPMGREQITKSAKAAQILGLRFELIVASRKARSIQTAEIMAEYTGYPISKIELSDTVKAMSRPEETINFIKEYQGLDSILITGHLPSLAKVSSALLTGNQYLEINIENGGLMQINVMLPKSKGALNWYLSPVHLAQIANS
ncbi:histidine phosphatase family protein [Pseudodesulfovibrio sp. zrk46]|uniref:SixA phosphatase family protein n=1 Tax=Pseudodesulfovibrio sp. zrk46 TaxID=2725288 RepID=UPI001FFC8032|nr:histidine phosphatase family protein [Pseudodesulfovibrio sp. zrk46]